MARRDGAGGETIICDRNTTTADDAYRAKKRREPVIDGTGYDDYELRMYAYADAGKPRTNVVQTLYGIPNIKQTVAALEKHLGLVGGKKYKHDDAHPNVNNSPRVLTRHALTAFIKTLTPGSTQHIIASAILCGENRDRYDLAVQNLIVEIKTGTACGYLGKELHAGADVLVTKELNELANILKQGSAGGICDAYVIKTDSLSGFVVVEYGEVSECPWNWSIKLLCANTKSNKQYGVGAVLLGAALFALNATHPNRAVYLGLTNGANNTAGFAKYLEHAQKASRLYEAAGFKAIPDGDLVRHSKAFLEKYQLAMILSVGNIATAAAKCIRHAIHRKPVAPGGGGVAGVKAGNPGGGGGGESAAGGGSAAGAGDADAFSFPVLIEGIRIAMDAARVQELLILLDDKPKTELKSTRDEITRALATWFSQRYIAANILPANRDEYFRDNCMNPVFGPYKFNNIWPDHAVIERQFNQLVDTRARTQPKVPRVSGTGVPGPTPGEWPRKKARLSDMVLAKPDAVGYVCGGCNQHTYGSTLRQCWVLCDYCDDWDHSACAINHARTTAAVKPDKFIRCGGAGIRGNPVGTIVFKSSKQRRVYYKCTRHPDPWIVDEMKN